jgi:small subunit ribosomal protein S17e
MWRHAIINGASFTGTSGSHCQPYPYPSGQHVNHGTTGVIMGIKPSYIKTLGNELLKKQPENFSKNFDENKQQLGISAAIPSKRVRNRIAGYIARKVNSKKRV